MAYTLEEHETLTKAIASGALRVEYADKRVEYRSLKDMLTLKSAMEIELGLTTKKSGRTSGRFDKGL
jgi:hypothetical protein